MYILGALERGVLSATAWKSHLSDNKTSQNYASHILKKHCMRKVLCWTQFLLSLGAWKQRAVQSSETWNWLQEGLLIRLPKVMLCLVRVTVLIVFFRATGLQVILINRAKKKSNKGKMHSAHLEIRKDAVDLGPKGPLAGINTRTPLLLSCRTAQLWEKDLSL